MIRYFVSFVIPAGIMDFLEDFLVYLYPYVLTLLMPTWVMAQSYSHGSTDGTR